MDGSVWCVFLRSFGWYDANLYVEHTLLVTETGVEVLTAANADSPGGPVPMPTTRNGTGGANGVSNA